MALAEVKTLYETNYRDIPGMLRKAADDIEKGEYGEALDVLMILHVDRGCEVFGWGGMEFIEALGMLELGRQRLHEVWQSAKRQAAP